MLVFARRLLLQSPCRAAPSLTSVRGLATDRFGHERSLLAVAGNASPAELTAGYGRAVEAATGSTPGPLLPIKLAELASAFRVLSAEGPGLGAAVPSASASSSGLRFDLAPDAGDEKSEKQKQIDLRAGRALAAAKAYASKKGGGGGHAAAAAGTTDVKSTPEHTPEWVVLGKDIENGWQRALETLDRSVAGAAAAAAPDSDAAGKKAAAEMMATAEAVFRRQAEIINADVEHYNLLVPILRMQRAPKMDRLLDMKIKAAKEKFEEGMQQPEDGI